MTLTVDNLTDPETIIRSINLVSGFLAKRDIKQLDIKSIGQITGKYYVDVAVLLGNSIVASVDKFAHTLNRDLAEKYIIAGGKGHSTSLLRKSAKSEFDIETDISQDLSEAEILYEMLTKRHSIDRSTIYLEKKSTNCGDNAIKVKELLENEGLTPKSYLLIQDPTMQLRTHASFLKAWENEFPITVINDPVFVPKVKLEKNQIMFNNPNIPGIWPMKRFISLILSEIPRLRNDQYGYGPNGKGFITAVDIPPEIQEAHQSLRNEFEEYFRPM